MFIIRIKLGTSKVFSDQTIFRFRKNIYVSIAKVAQNPLCWISTNFKTLCLAREVQCKIVFATKHFLRAHEKSPHLCFAPFSAATFFTIRDFVHLFLRAVIFLCTTDVSFETKNEIFYSKLFFIITLYSYTCVQGPSHIKRLIQ